MNVMHVVLKPRYSGAEVLVRDLCLEQIKLGHKLAFVAMLPSEGSFEQELERLEKAGTTNIIPDKTLSRLGRLNHIHKSIKLFEPDIVFAHSIIPAMYSRLADLKGRRIISVLHAATNNDYNNKIWVTTEKVLRHLSKGVIAVSEEGKNNYIKKFYCGKPVVTIRNGLDFSEAKRAASLRENRIKRSLILQVGRIAPVKGQHNTIEAVAKLIKLHPNIKLKLAGLVEDFNYFCQLKAQVKSHGMEDSIEFIGPRSDIFDLLADSDLYVMPSYAESQGIAMLEALAVGVPVVATEIDVFREFRKMAGVWLVGTGNSDALANAMESALKAQTTVYERDVSNFDIKRTATEYLDFLHAN
ncbi:MAG: hypothetical protein CML65_02560 [Rhodobacteraceae bacterium]|nr:hypothetical protein [Paracoccaceae bacterium]|tara:strand:+ start:6012 stop:7079 length:1068 start_codon:yes stop_codon:yes gene_type:complete